MPARQAATAPTTARAGEDGRRPTPRARPDWSMAAIEETASSCCAENAVVQRDHLAREDLGGKVFGHTALPVSTHLLELLRIIKQGDDRRCDRIGIIHRDNDSGVADRRLDGTYRSCHHGDA